MLAVLTAVGSGVGVSFDASRPVHVNSTPTSRSVLASVWFEEAEMTTTTTTEPPTTTTVAPVAAVRQQWPSSLEPCGGDLPPCSVKMRESGGNYSAINPTGCGGKGCYGAWQFSGEWAGKLGLPADLASATPEQQDNAARLLWDGGRGCSNWAACA